MSQTHKGDRKKSGFEVEDHATILKNNIRELSLARNFGLKVRESRTPRNFAQWSEVSRERWKEQERQRMERLKWLDEQFLVKARDWIDDDLRRMMHGTWMTVGTWTETSQGCGNGPMPLIASRMNTSCLPTRERLFTAGLTTGSSGCNENTA